MSHHPPPAGPFSVAVTPAEVAPGDEITLTVAFAAEAGAERSIDPAELIGCRLALCDADGEVLAEALIDRDGADRPCLEPLILLAPDHPGPLGWTLRLLEPDDPPADFPPTEAPVEATVMARRPGVSVWGLPDAVEPGAEVRFRIGIKCPFGGDSAGWPFELRDAAGATLAEGRLGQAPWPGTEGLCHAEVALTAPAQPGRHRWQVVALPPAAEADEGPAAPAPLHAPSALPVTLHVTEPAALRLRIVAVDATTGAPVAGARVTAHPRRTRTDAEGGAELALPRGHHVLFVAGPAHFALRSEAELTEDTELRVVLEPDRAFSEEDLWA